MPVPMYAVIRTGGKQYRVETGQKLEVELLSGTDPKDPKAKASGAPGSEVELSPVLLVDGASVLATPSDLGKATVRARVLEETKGEKIRGFKYKSKSNQRKRWGHRQQYSMIEITEITPGGATKAPATKTPAKKAPAKKTATKSTTAKKATAKKDEA